MKNRIFKIVSLFLAVVCLLSGCAIGGTKLKTVIVYPKGKEVQAVLAFNPIYSLDGNSIIAFNDINNSIASDASDGTLSSLTDFTNWKWVSRSIYGWRIRSAYTVDSWRNRGNIATGKLKAYSYNSDGTLSLMCYATSQYDVQSYGDYLPEMGILMSTSGYTQENISYVIPNDGLLDITGGTLTMVASVGGVETGFLDNSDGSIRTAVVNIMINNTVLWSGEFGMGVGPNGENVTYLEYPSFSQLPVKYSDVVSIGIQLNGEKATEIYDPETNNGNFDEIIYEDKNYYPQDDSWTDNSVVGDNGTTSSEQDSDIIYEDTTSTPEQNDVSDDTTTSEQNNVSTPEQSQTNTSSQDETSKPNQDVSSTPSQENTSTPNQDVSSIPSQDNTSTPNQDVSSTPSQDNTSTPNQDVSSTPSMEDTSTPEEDTPSEPEEELPKELSFVDGYDSRFEIVYPENASIAVQKIANNFFTKLETVTETSVRLKTDTSEYFAETEYEILIGETNREASKEVYSMIRGYRKNCANDYIVKVVGNDVVIAGGSEIALENAYNFFVDTYLLDDRSKVPTDMYHVSRPEVQSCSIGGTDISKYVIRTERYPSILTKRAAKDLANYFITVCGITIPVENDQKTTENEILVGLTERSGISAKVFKEQSLDYINGFDAEQYNIFYKNGKLFAEAGSDYAANLAVNLIIKELSNSNDISASFSKSGVYTTSDDESKYSLSNGYGLAWNDEFLSSTKDGTPIDNKLTYWFDDAPAGDDAATYVAHKPDSKLVQEILELDETDPLRYLLGEKKKHNTYGDYYPFGKMSQPGFGKAYGVVDNMMYQTTKFDVKTGFSNSRLNTKKTMSFRYGIFEVRQIASTQNATCTALWFTGASGLADDCEIDLYENFGTQYLHPNLHTWANYHTNHTNHGGMGDFKAISARLEDGQQFYDTFHYIGMEWSKDYVDFYLDGEIFCAVPMTEEKWYAFEQKIYPRIDMGVTGGFYLFDSTGYIGTKGGIEELLNFESTQYTDYVRIYQKNGERHRVWDYLAD